MENFGRAAPDHDHAGAALGAPEFFDVGHQGVGLVHLRARGFLVGTVDAANVFMVEDGLHRLDGLQRLFDLLEEVLIEHLGVGRGLVGRVFINVPAAEDEIVQAGQWHEVLDIRAASVGALAEADGGELRERTDGQAEPALHGLHTRDEGSGNSADTGNQNSQFALGRGDCDGGLRWQNDYSSPVKSGPGTQDSNCYPINWMQVRATTAIPTVVADDEAPALDELVFLLRGFPEIDVVATARNGPEAVAAIEQHEPDLVFLDVQMPGLDGLGVINKLRADHAPIPSFVLCTAYDQYALEAFRLEVLDYLLKPVDRERLSLTVDRARRQMLDPEPPSSSSAPIPARNKIVVRTSGHNLIVDVADIIYATIDDGLITVVTTTMEGQASFKTIEEMLANLDPAVFWRAHRSYLVNINQIKEVIAWFKSSYQLRMNDKKNSEIPVSRVQTRRLRELFKL